MANSEEYVQIALFWGGNIIQSPSNVRYARGRRALDWFRRDSNLAALIMRIYQLTGVDEKESKVRIWTPHVLTDCRGLNRTELIELDAEHNLQFFLNPIGGYKYLELYLEFQPITVATMHTVDEVLCTDIHNIGPSKMDTNHHVEDHVEASHLAYDIPSNSDLGSEKVDVEQCCTNDGEPPGDIRQLIMSGIPVQITREILLRVPAKALLRFRAVCKAWRHMIDDPSFVKPHTINSQLTSTSILIRKDEGGGLFSFSWDLLGLDDEVSDDDNDRNTLDARPVKSFVRRGVPRHDLDSDDDNDWVWNTLGARPVKSFVRRGIPRLCDLPAVSCNGLFLLWHENHNRTWAIWNPLTKEFHELPQPNSADLFLIGCGIGYDSATDDYKVVRIDKLYGDRKVQTLVYSLKLDSWHVIEDCPWVVRFHSEGVFVNGALHWRSWDCIVALDLATEEYQQLPLPPPLTNENRHYLGRYRPEHFNALGGFLALTCSCPVEHSVGWVMADNGAWTKLFSVRDVNITLEVDIIGHVDLRPIAYWKDKGQVLFQCSERFICWDIVNHSVRKVTCPCFRDSRFTSQIWPGSLFRLDSRVGGNVPVKRTAGVKRMRKTTKIEGMDVSFFRWKLSAEVSDTKYDYCGVWEYLISSIYLQAM